MNLKHWNMIFKSTFLMWKSTCTCDFMQNEIVKISIFPWNLNKYSVKKNCSGVKTSIQNIEEILTEYWLDTGVVGLYICIGKLSPFNPQISGMMCVKSPTLEKLSMMHQRDHSPLSKSEVDDEGGGGQMKMRTKGEKGDCLHDCIYVSRKKTISKCFQNHLVYK